MANFTDEIINRVWQRATPVANNDPNIWRKDYAGAWIRRDHYGKESKYGWEIDHLRPVSLGGTDVLDNLYPLHWQNNRKKLIVIHFSPLLLLLRVLQILKC